MVVQVVVWRWEGEAGNLPSNVVTFPWLPLQVM